MEDQIHLHTKTSILALIDCPSTLQIGMDNIQLKIGQKFKGIKHIPPGPHYIYYSQQDENYMYKIGFFVYGIPGEVYVKKWDPEVDDFVDIQRTEEGERYERAGKNMELDPYLANYPLEHTNVWKSLSGSISKNTISRIEPVSKKIYTTNAEYKPEEQKGDKEKFDIIRGSLFFTEIPTKYVEYEVEPKQRTNTNFDKTSMFNQLLEKGFKNDIKEFFGELQFAFSTFILAENIEGFEQWKKMVILLSFSDSLVKDKPKIFEEYIPILYAQLQQFPKDFFEDSITKNNFMSSCLQNLLELRQDETASLKIRNRVQKLEAMLKEKFGFTSVFDELDLGEDAPEICEQFESMVKLHEEGESTNIFTVIDTSKPFSQQVHQAVQPGGDIKDRDIEADTN